MAFENGKFTPEYSYDPSHTHPQDMYSTNVHNGNLELAHDFLSTFGENANGALVTPWVLSGEGIARVVGVNKQLVTEIAHNMPNNTPEIGIAEHYVKHHIVFDKEGFDGRHSLTRYYLPMHQCIGIMFFNTPVSAGMFMGVPSVRYNPDLSSRLIQQYLSQPDQKKIAHPEDLNGSLAERPIHRRGWGRIILSQ